MTDRDLAKKAATKAARDRVLAAFAPLGGKAKRPRPNAAFVEAGEVYVCVDIQHSQSVVDGGLNFCVNVGVVPVRLHRDGYWGFVSKTPSVPTCVVQERLTLRDGYDWWWEINPPYILEPALTEINIAAKRFMETNLPQELTLEACLRVETVRPWVRSKVDAWLKKNA